MKKLTVLFIFLICTIPVISQITLQVNTQNNTICNGNPCNYSGPTILINEVMLSPSIGDGAIYDSDNTRRGEWIELYNPDICKSIDISCYFLGNNTPDGANYGGGFTLPAGTVVPPRGFVVVRGTNASAVPSNLLIQNGGKTIEVIVNDLTKICLGGGNRLWFPNAGGWFAFYDENGSPQDAISWFSTINSCMTCPPCNPVTSGCPYTGGLPSYNDIPSNRKTYMTTLDPALYFGQSFRRIPDGAAWQNAPSSPTIGNCNSTCIPPPVITCNGQAVVSPSGGTRLYHYIWDDTQATTDSVCVGLCAGTYHVTVTDSAGMSIIQTVVIEDRIPVVSLAAFSNICVDHAPIELSGGLPAGGTYSGAGVSNGWFDPSAAGPGTHSIRYEYSDSVSCEGSATSNILVNPLPVVSITSYTAVCVDHAPVILSGGNPPGGVYSGTGVTSGVFNPSDAGAGTHNMVYTYTDENGCTNSDTSTITVNPLPIVNLYLDPNTCIDQSPFQLAGGIPDGGTYSGPGVVNGIFNPAIAGIGNHFITYSYTDGNNCTLSTMDSIFVRPLPEVDFTIDPNFAVPAYPVTFTSSYTILPGTWFWDFGDGHSESHDTYLASHTYSQEGHYIVYHRVVSQYGCADTAYKSVEIVKIEIPNVFTPDGDGINDYFEIKGIKDFFTGIRLEVFNRWGKKIYENANYHNDWNGNGYADGVYYFIITFPRNVILPVNGSVTIIRKK